MPRTSNKKQELVDAATQLIHQQGFSETSLADIAEASAVPLGNVYYYFKTKDQIAQAVIDKWAKQFQQLFEKWDKLPQPKQRLLAYLTMAQDIKQSLVHHGCPIGSLCQELSKDDSQLSAEAGTLLANIVAWVTRQYQEMGKRNAEELGIQFVIDLQGSILMASALHDEQIFHQQLQRLRKWVEAT